jgi:hypothetical protein
MISAGSMVESFWSLIVTTAALATKSKLPASAAVTGTMLTCATTSSTRPSFCVSIGPGGISPGRASARSVLSPASASSAAASAAVTAATGWDIDDALLAHIWPTHHENVHFYGTHSVHVDGELAKLDSDGYRPLRADTLTAVLAAQSGAIRG